MAQAPNAPADEKQEELKLVEVSEIPKKMQALQCVCYDKDMSKALQLNEIDVPECPKNKIMIKVCSVSLNPVDWKVAMGYLQGMFKTAFPTAIGRDLAGVIVKVGEDVSANKDNTFKVGMRVAAMVMLYGEAGSFSEYVVTDPEKIVSISNDLSYDMAAALPLVGLTSYQAIIVGTPLGKTKDLKVLILGGSTSCGLGAIQMARNCGAKEIAVTSSQVDLCKKMGATTVFNYREKDAPEWYEALKGKSYDILYDCIGDKDTWDRAQTVLADKGAYFVTIAGGGKPGGANKDKDNPNTTYSGFFQNGTKELKDLYGMVNSKHLEVVLDEDSPYTLDKWSDMVAKSIAHKAHGKLIMNFCKADDKGCKC